MKAVHTVTFRLAPFVLAFAAGVQTVFFIPSPKGIVWGVALGSTVVGWGVFRALRWRWTVAWRIVFLAILFGLGWMRGSPRHGLIADAARNTGVLVSDWRSSPFGYKVVVQGKGGERWALHARDSVGVESDAVGWVGAGRHTRRALAPMAFDERAYYRGVGVSQVIEVDTVFRLSPSADRPIWVRWRLALTRLMDTWPENAAGFYAALLFGDKSGLDESMRDSFARAGVVHILAVSGLHVGIVDGLLGLLLPISIFKRRWSRWIRLLLITAVLWLFVGLTGAGTSVVRAALLFTVVRWGRAAGGESTAMEGLWWVGWWILWMQPYAWFSLSFQLSFAAVLGILYGKAPLDQRLKTLKLPGLLHGVIRAALVSVCAQLATTPLTLYYFHQFPNYFLLTNLFLLPVLPLVVFLGIAGIVLTALGWNPGTYLDALVAFLNRATQWVSAGEGAVSVVYLTLYSAIGLAVVLLVTWWWLVRPSVGRTLWWSAITSVALFAVAVNSNNGAYYYQSPSPVIELAAGDTAWVYGAEDEMEKWVQKADDYHAYRGVKHVIRRAVEWPVEYSRDTGYAISISEVPSIGDAILPSP